MATISSIGTGSGIDLEGLVSQIIEAERTPTERRLTLREATAEASISGFGNLSTSLDALRTTLNNLSDNANTSLRTVTSTDVEYVSVTADNDALVGNHDIQVLNLVSNHKLASGDFATPATVAGHGTLTIGIGSTTFDVEIEEGVNDSIAGIRDAINEAAIDRGLSASLITVDNGLEDGGTVTKLVLSAHEGGQDNIISVSVADGDGDSNDTDGLSQLAYDPDNPPAGGQTLPPLSETHRPDGTTFSAIGFQGSPAFGDIDDDPDSPDANFLIANDTNTDVSVRTSFSDPSRDISTGADLQEIRVEARKTAGSGVSDASLSIEIYEQGNPTALFTSTAQNVTSADGEVFSFTFDAAILADISAGNLEVVVNGGRSGGTPSSRSAVDIGAIEFNSFSAGTSSSSMQEISEAADARITVDGFLARSSTNNFADVLEGVEITALRPPADELNPETATISVAESSTELQANLESFVSSYNEVFITIDSLTGYDAQTQTGGLLTGDASVRQIEVLLRRTLFQSLGDSSATFRNLAAIGVTTERNGTISINNDALNDALDTDISAITNLVSGDDGVMNRLKDLVDSFVGSGGVIKAKTDGLDRTISDIGEQRERLQTRLDAIEARFRRQFTGLDTLIAQFQSTQNFLTQQLSSIASITSNRR